MDALLLFDATEGKGGLTLEYMVVGCSDAKPLMRARALLSGAGNRGSEAVSPSRFFEDFDGFIRRRRAEYRFTFVDADGSARQAVTTAAGQTCPLPWEIHGTVPLRKACATELDQLAALPQPLKRARKWSLDDLCECCCLLLRHGVSLSRADPPGGDARGGDARGRDARVGDARRDTREECWLSGRVQPTRGALANVTHDRVAAALGVEVAEFRWVLSGQELVLYLRLSSPLSLTTAMLSPLRVGGTHHVTFRPVAASEPRDCTARQSPWVLLHSMPTGMQEGKVRATLAAAGAEEVFFTQAEARTVLLRVPTGELSACITAVARSWRGVSVSSCDESEAERITARKREAMAYARRVVRLSNMPQQWREEQVVQLLQGIRIAPRGVHMVMFRDDTTSTGEAFVELLTDEDVVLALERGRQVEKSANITLRQSHRREMIPW
eukprot:Hpha_TRINITY_DN15705_c2_g6::TRINITY_DN15705_c2_g6_i1::g.42078::m.42078